MQKARLDRTGLTVILVLILIGAGAVYWYSQRAVDVEFELQIRSDSGCSGTHPKYGTIADTLDLEIRDSDDRLLATVTMLDASSDPNWNCEMVGTASIPREDVYRVQIESWGTTSDAGLLDWEDVRTGHVLLINP